MKDHCLLSIETVNETTLLPNDQEAFALEPIEVTVGKDKRKRRKRKLVVDDKKNLTGDQIRSQLADTSDIVQAANVAPPTKLRYSIILFTYFSSVDLCHNKGTTGKESNDGKPPLKIYFPRKNSEL